MFPSSLYRYITPLLTSDDPLIQCLAIQSLRFFNDQADEAVDLLLVDNLNNASVEVVLNSLEALKHRPETGLTAALSLLNHDNDLDSEIKIAALKVIGTHSQYIPEHLTALDLLVKHVCDEDENWDGDWDDGVDVALAAANILAQHAMRLSTGQRERLWARFDHDPEPDLQTQLIRILIATSSKRVEALIFDNSLALKPNRLTRKILKSSHNKVLLYQVLKSSALDLHEIALTRLADLNAKEYLQDFLSLISSSNVQLQGIAAATLVRWQYPLSATYIIPLFTASGTCASISVLQSLSAIVKPDTLDWLVKQWQQGSLNRAHIGTLFHCAVRFSYDLNSLLPQYYQTFIELNATQKIDTLSVLTKLREITISAAFIRQTIESKQCDNAVKLLLIPYLWQQSTDEHIAYAKQLMFTSTPKLIQHSNKLVDSGKTTALPITAPQTATPMSTLMSLSAPLMESPASSSITNKKQPAKRARKVARIDPLSNRDLAVRYCNEASLVKAFLHQYLREGCTTPSTLIEIGRACVNVGIAYQTVKTDELHQQIISLILSPENTTSPYLIQWLGWRELQLNLDHIAINSNRLTLVKIAEISHDIPLLTSWLTHQYIGVKKAAAKRLLQISEPLSTPYRTTITAALDDPELTSLLRNSHLKEVTKVLIPLFTHNPKKALLSLSYINGDSAS